MVQKVHHKSLLNKEPKCTSHFRYSTLPNISSDLWKLVTSRVVVDTYYDVADSLFLLLNIWVKKREVDDRVKWIVSQVEVKPCISEDIDAKEEEEQQEFKLFISDETFDSEEECKEYLKDIVKKSALVLEEEVQFTTYQDIYKHQDVEIDLSSTELPDGSFVDHGRVKSLSDKNVDKWAKELKLEPGVHPIIEHISKYKKDVFQRIEVPHRYSMDQTSIPDPCLDPPINSWCAQEPSEEVVNFVTSTEFRECYKTIKGIKDNYKL